MVDSHLFLKISSPLFYLLLKSLAAAEQTTSTHLALTWYKTLPPHHLRAASTTTLGYATLGRAPSLNWGGGVARGVTSIDLKVRSQILVVKLRNARSEELRF